MWSGTSLIADGPEPGQCIPHHNGFELALALFILVGMVVSYLPQVRRTCLSRVLGLWKKTQANVSTDFAHF